MVCSHSPGDACSTFGPGAGFSQSVQEKIVVALDILACVQLRTQDPSPPVPEPSSKSHGFFPFLLSHLKTQSWTLLAHTYHPSTREAVPSPLEALGSLQQSHGHPDRNG